MQHNGKMTKPNPLDRQTDELFTEIHAQLRRLASSVLADERAGHTLQGTALVHEAWLKLHTERPASFQDRGHFFALAARAMRQVLVDHARKRAALKRGGNPARVTLVDGLLPVAEQQLDVLELEEALLRYEQLDPRGARIVELRFFGGLTETEVATELGLSRRTIVREWHLARAWLAEALAP